MPPSPSKFQPFGTKLSGTRTFEEVVARVVLAIRSGDLRTGDRLPSERRLAEDLGVSRATVRGAIRQLRDSGVVEVRPGSSGGTFVLTEHVPATIWHRPVDVDSDQVPSLLEVRRLLEPRVAQLASLRAESVDYAALRHTIELSRDALEDRQRFITLDIRFHLLIARAAHNSQIAALMNDILQQLEVVMGDLVMNGPPPGPDSAIEIHERTLAALLRGDPPEIANVMDEHLSLLERSWEQASGVALVRRMPHFLTGADDASVAPNH